MNPGSWLAVASVAGVVWTGVALALRIAGVAGAGAPAATALLPVLVASGALCVVGLTRRQAPSVAWLAAIGALTLATLDLAAFGRANRDGLTAEGWQWLAILVSVGTLLAVGSAARYASERHRRLAGWVVPASVIATILVAAVCAAVIATLEPAAPPPPESPLGNLAVVSRMLLGVTIALALLGVLGDLRPAARRTRDRLDARPPRADGLAAAAGWAVDAVRILADELAPGRARARHAATEERERIAVELHAEVVPAVRRALREAERGGSAERLAVALRDVLGEIDGLAADRRSIILDELGLLAALEWLAERTEERSDVRVTIDVPDDAGVDADALARREGRPPRRVEAAAFRVAQLALENVVRHAPAATARLELAADARRVRLLVSDDGPGLPVDADRVAVTSGRRGLADMRAEADACGALLSTSVARDGRGTLVRFEWTPG